MNATTTRPQHWDWRADLAAARDVDNRQREGYRGFLEWFENWRMRKRLKPSRDTAKLFSGEARFAPGGKDQGRLATEAVGRRDGLVPYVAGVLQGGGW